MRVEGRYLGGMTTSLEIWSWVMLSLILDTNLKCPLHGDRFQLYPHLFTPDWLREREIKRWPRHSEQYLKAWNASFPRNLWTIQEVAVAGRCWLLPQEIRETQEIVRLATLPAD